MTPFNLKITLNKTGSITIRWDRIPDAERYHGYMSPVGESYSIYNETNLTATSFTTKENLPANKQYKFFVAAYGKGKYLDSDGGTVLLPSDFYNTTPLEIPGNVRAKATTISVLVSFESVPRATEYDILFDGEVYTTARTLYEVSGLTPDTAHTYCVRAKNRTKTGEYSASQRVRTLVPSLPVPGGLQKSASQTSASVSWASVAGALSYDLIFQGVTYNLTQTSKTFQGLKAGTGYSFQVRAKNAESISSYSALNKVTTAPPPAQVRAEATRDSVTVNWGSVTGAAGYLVRFQNKETLCAGPPAVFTGLAPNTEYACQVCSRSEDGAGNYSALTTIRTLEGQEQGPVTEVTARTTDSSVTLSWPKMAGATGYDVQFSGNLYAVTGTEKTFTGRAPNTTYSYRIRSKNRDGVSEYGPTRTAVTAPEALMGFQATGDENSLTLSWNEREGATGYEVLLDGKTYETKTPPLIITGLEANHSYPCRVRVKNQYGESAYSAVSAVLTAPPLPPALPSTGSRKPRRGYRGRRRLAPSLIKWCSGGKPNGI